MSARNDAIVAAHRRGVSESELARAYDVSRQRIHQIIRGVDRRARAEHDRIERLQRDERGARQELEALMAHRRSLNARIRQVLTYLRAAQEEQAAMEVDRILGV